MLTLNDGRNELWQWDTGRTLTVDADCSQVHFSNKVFGRSVDVDVVDGTAVIPDVLLQVDKELIAWAFVGTAENGYTKISKVFKVKKRNKPADYVFTPPEQTSLEEIKEKIEYLESIQDPDAIKNAVEDYLEQNPIEAPVQSVNGQMGEVKLTAEDVGAISKDDLQEATNEALAQAKASGEFDGKDGKDGYTPIKGVDYFDGQPGQPGKDGEPGKDYILTEADKQEIAEQAAELVEVPEVDLNGLVKSVNGITPDKNGNVEVEVGSGTAVASAEPAEDDIPKIFFGGALQQTKTEKVVSFRYISKTQDISGYAEIKAQGNLSMSFPKKNQTVKLYKDSDCTEKLKVDFKGWGKQNKHCYKANWIDLSHARNIVSARLWGDIVKSRSNYAELPELLRTSPNHGAVDGFPIKVYAEGVYQGRYTLNIPKDKWMANMDDELDEHCILCGEGYTSGCFRVASTGEWTDEVHDSMPSLISTRWLEVINFVMNSTDEEFRANLGNYFDVQSLIDYHLFGLAICGLDAYGKNQLYMTYDGQKWIASAYDMDSTWGLYYNGSKMVSTAYGRTEYEDFVGDREGNLLYIRLEANFYNELQSRWAELRTGALSIENIINRFERFTDIAPAELVKEDYASTTGGGKFTGIPSQTTNNIQQIRAFSLARQAWTDEYVSALNGESGGEEEPDEPVTPEVTLTSISATYNGGNVLVGTSVTALTGITVTAHYSDDSTANVTDYTLSGTIAEGSNTITVSYGGKTTTFTVTGIDDGIDYTLDALNGIGWNANSDIDKSTGELTTKANHYVSNRFSLQKCLYVIPSSSVYTYTILIAWDAVGNFIGAIGDATREYTFTADPDWQYAIRVFSEDGSEPNITLTPVDNRTTMASTAELDLASLSWATGTVAGTEANIGSWFADHGITNFKQHVHHTNYLVNFTYSLDGFKNVENELNFSYFNGWLHCLSLRTAEKATAYFTENNTKLIFNG